MTAKKSRQCCGNHAQYIIASIIGSGRAPSPEISLVKASQGGRIRFDWCASCQVKLDQLALQSFHAVSLLLDGGDLWGSYARYGMI